MLSPGNADLVRRDQALAGLATLLDPDAFAEALRAAVPDAVFDYVRPNYLRYKPATNCLVRYDLGLGGTTVQATAKTFGAHRRGKLEKTRRSSADISFPDPGSYVFDGITAIVRIFPSDDKLSHLWKLAGVRSRETLLCQIFPTRPELWSGRLHGLQYKPERRYVARLDGESGPQAVVKFHGAARYSVALRAGEAGFRSGQTLTLPRMVGKESACNAIAFEWLAGLPFREALEAPERDRRRASQVGVALAELHRQDLGGLSPRGRAWEVSRLRAQADAIGHLCPRMAPLAEPLVERIARRLSDLPELRVPRHGDFNDHQVLLAEDRVAIIDLDEAALGDPAYDLGLFAAHLERHALVGILEAKRVERLIEALLSGYLEGSGPGALDRVALYTAYGLVQLSLEPFRTFDPDWVSRTEAMLARAGAVMG